MELYLFSLIAVMVLISVVLKGIFCWMHCSNHKTSKEIAKYVERQKKEHMERERNMSSSQSRLVHMEIPMDDFDRSSTPVSIDDRRTPIQRTDIHSDV